MYRIKIASPMQCLKMKGCHEWDTSIPSVPHSTACTLLRARTPNLNVVHPCRTSCTIGWLADLCTQKSLRHNLRLTSRSTATLNAEIMRQLVGTPNERWCKVHWQGHSEENQAVKMPALRGCKCGRKQGRQHNNGH